jgi:two-component system sensor histidine kinase HydH
LLNLVSNAAEAIQATQQAGEVHLRTAWDPSSGLVTLMVADTGPGMDEETAQQIFTPYFTTKETGTGLGLAIVHRIVEDHLGQISVQATPGQGTTFTIRLPSS